MVYPDWCRHRFLRLPALLLPRVCTSLHPAIRKKECPKFKANMKLIPVRDKLIKHPLNLHLCFRSFNCFLFIRSYIWMEKNFPGMCRYSSYWRCSWVIPGFSKCTEEFRILVCSGNQCNICSLAYVETITLYV